MRAIAPAEVDVTYSRSVARMRVPRDPRRPRRLASDLMTNGRRLDRRMAGSMWRTGGKRPPRRQPASRDGSAQGGQFTAGHGWSGGWRRSRPLMCASLALAGDERYVITYVNEASADWSARWRSADGGEDTCRAPLCDLSTCRITPNPPRRRCLATRLSPLLEYQSSRSSLSG